MAWEEQKRTVLHPLEFAAVLAAARTSGPHDRALVCRLGMLGLRVSEACAADIADLRYEAGYELLQVRGKGARPADGLSGSRSGRHSRSPHRSHGIPQDCMSIRKEW